MYLLFKLPEDNWEANYVYTALNHNLGQWSQQYDITYRFKFHRQNVRVTFDDEQSYSVFAMSWCPHAEYLQNYLTDYSLVEPMRRV